MMLQEKMGATFHKFHLKYVKVWQAMTSQSKRMVYEATPMTLVDKIGQL